MTIKGVDVAALRGLASGMTASKQQIEVVVAGLTQELHGLHWVGDDRLRFDRDWAGHVAHLSNVVVALEGAAADAFKHALRQEAISGGPA